VIRFSCPNCLKVLTTPEVAAGRKVACPGCGQRLMVPPPTQNRNKTVLGQSVPNPASIPSVPLSRPEPTTPVLPPGKVLVGCPGCGRSILLPPNEMTWQIECSRCNTRFVPAGTPVPPQRPPDPDTEADPHDDYQPRGSEGAFGTAKTGYPQREYDSGLDDVRRFVAGRKHSGLGIASFIIALLVGGLDVILAIVIATNVAKSAPRHRDYGDTTELKANIMAGGMSMVCLNCMSIPLCLVGAGLGLVGLIAHRDQNQLFTWIGLLGNGVVILGVVGLYLFGAMLGH
jgi:DNA-directed RNA polymerase subunit RPC12/RpoP